MPQYVMNISTGVASTLQGNTLISRLSRSPNREKALSVFLSMRAAGTPIDEYTLPPLLLRCLPSSSSSSSSSSLPLSLLSLSLKLGLLSHPHFLSSLLLSSPSLPLPISLSLFLHAPPPLRLDHILWTSMLSALSRSSRPLSALSLFSRMLSLRLPLDEALLVSALSSSAALASLPHARSLHALSLRSLPSLTPTLRNALLHAYLKCGAFASADAAFRNMPRRDRDVLSWTSIILGHGLNGRAHTALRLFDQMCREGEVRPNAVTFLGVLSACGHSGMVGRTREVLHMMGRCGVPAELKHYACLVDALGRAGELAEAERLVEEMPVQADEAVLGALLSGCRVHGNVEVGERVARRLMEMHPEKSGYYASLANLYSDAGRFDDAQRVRDYMKRMNVGKLAGVTSIGLDGSSLRTES